MKRGEIIEKKIRKWSEICEAEVIECMDEFAENFAKWISEHPLQFQAANNGNWIGLDLITHTSKSLLQLYIKEIE